MYLTEAFQLTLTYDHLPGYFINAPYVPLTVPQRIRHKEPHAAAEHERLEDQANISTGNYDLTGYCQKAPPKVSH